MRLKLNPAHLGLAAVAFVFVSSMSILGGRAYRQSAREAENPQLATRPPADGHRVSLALKPGK